MTLRLAELEPACEELLRRHLADPSEQTLHEAYELGRAALTDGVGVLELITAVSRASRATLETNGDHPDAASARFESFLLECLSPYQLAMSGAREANAALRLLDQRRDEHMRKIAHELHDQAGQMLAVVNLGLDQLRPHLRRGGEVRLARVEGLLDQVQDEIRRLSHELSPAILDDLGLLPALRVLCEGVSRRSGLAARVRGATDGRLPREVEAAFYRAVQEALNNVVRHAQASWVEVEVKREEHEVMCRVLDDGRGFDPRVVLGERRGGGIGLDSMRDRLHRLGGALEIGSAPGSGTIVMMRIPLEVNHA